MPTLGRILVAAWFTCVVLPVALAADQTTAVWSDGHTAALSDEELVRYALASPGAGYPEAAQKAKLTGTGLYELQMHLTGKTTQVKVIRSSGHAVLDQAAKGAFMKWRFKPGVFLSVRIPVSWSVNKVRK